MVDRTVWITEQREFKKNYHLQEDVSFISPLHLIMRMCSRFANPGGSEAVFCTISFFISFLREPDNCSRAPFHSFMGIVRLLKFCESIQHVSFHTATASPMPIQVQQVPQSYVWSIPRRVWGAGFLREITQWLWRKSIITYSDRQDCAANKTRDDTD